MGYYAAAGVDRRTRRSKPWAWEELVAHGGNHIDVADAAGALRSREFPDENEDAPMDPLVTKLQLQLRALASCSGRSGEAGRRQGRRRFAERYVEV